MAIGSIAIVALLLVVLVWTELAIIFVEIQEINAKRRSDKIKEEMYLSKKKYLRKKLNITVIISLVMFFVISFYIPFNMNEFLESIKEHALKEIVYTLIILGVWIAVKLIVAYRRYTVKDLVPDVDKRNMIG